MGENAQQAIPRPAVAWPSMCAVPAMAVDFLDQQCGIATGRASPSQRSGLGRPRAGFDVSGTRSTREIAVLLLDQLQQGTPALALWRFRLLRSFRRLVGQHRIA